MRTTKIWEKEYKLTLEDTEYTESRWFINYNWEKTSFSWHFNPFEINIKESNYMKSSYLSWDDVRKTCEWTLKMNWIQIFECHTRTYERTYEEIKRFIEKIEILDIQEFIEWKVIWKMVWFREQLFIIENTIVEQGCVILKPKDWIRKPFLYEMDEEIHDFELKDTIKEHITNIDWYV